MSIAPTVTLQYIHYSDNIDNACPLIRYDSYASETLAGDGVQASTQSFPAATETCIPRRMAALTASSKAWKPFAHLIDMLHGARIICIIVIIIVHYANMDRVQ